MYKRTGWGFALVALITAGAIYAISAIRPQFGIDLQGGTELTYELDLSQTPRSAADDNVAETVKDIIANRLNAYGLKEISIATQGQERIVVQIPGVSDSGYIKQQVESAGNLEFMLIAPTENTGELGALWQAVNQYNQEEREWARRIDEDPENTQLRLEQPRRPQVWLDLQAKNDAYNRSASDEAPKWAILPRAESVSEGGIKTFRNLPGSYEVLHFEEQYRVSGRHLENANGIYDEQAKPAIGFEFDPVGAGQFYDLTGQHEGRILAIVLDQRIIQSAAIEERIGGSGRITGSFDWKEVNSIVNLLRGGSLPAKPRLISESTVGSMLGRETIESGTTAVIAGLMVVLLFMLVYYSIGGIVANIALVLNIVLILAYVLVFRQTLTLPGIAGIILTIGMAVDANILIFERVREELRRRKPLEVALGTGYRRAFWVIFDSNLTTLLTGTVLFRFGTGPIKGFAVTLIAGILASFFTSVFVSRLILSLGLNLKIIRSFPMMSLIGVPRVDFQRFKKPFVVFSLIVIVASWALVIGRGRNNYGVDFRGGSKVTMKLAREVPRADVEGWIEASKHAPADASPEEQARAARAQGVFQSFSVQSIAEPGESAGTTGAASRFTIVVNSKPAEETAGAAPEGEGEEESPPAAGDAPRDEVRELLTQILRQRDLYLPEPFPRMSAEELWVPAAQSPGGDPDPAHLGLQLQVNLIDFNPRDGRPEEALKNLLDAHLEDAWPAGEGEEPLSVLEVVKLGETPIADGARQVQTFRITTTGYVEPTEATRALSAVPGHHEVEESVMSFFRGQSEVFERLAEGQRQVLELSEPFPEVVSIGARVASNLQTQALIAFFIAIVAIIFYLSLRFEFAFGIAAILALVHDVLISIGVLVATDIFFGDFLSLKINLPEVAALLTIVGYSVNDTIVVFDRIRENLKSGRKNVDFEDLVNMSINQTLSRTVWTSATTLVVVLTLLAFGGPSIQGFAFTFAVGLVAGTYSSVFVASPALVFLRRKAAERRERLKELAV